jgi:hypothetical protein
VARLAPTDLQLGYGLFLLSLLALQQVVAGLYRHYRK